MITPSFDEIGLFTYSMILPTDRIGQISHNFLGAGTNRKPEAYHSAVKFTWRLFRYA